jgi:hypothetical protein
LRRIPYLNYLLYVLLFPIFYLLPILLLHYTKLCNLPSKAYIYQVSQPEVYINCEKQHLRLYWHTIPFLRRPNHARPLSLEISNATHMISVFLSKRSGTSTHVWPEDMIKLLSVFLKTIIFLCELILLLKISCIYMKFFGNTVISWFCFEYWIRRHFSSITWWISFLC